MQRKNLVPLASITSCLAMTGQAYAGIPIASWSLPYLFGGVVIMFVFLGLCSLIKPKEIDVGHVTFGNSPALAVIFRYVGGFFGIATMFVVAWGIYDAVFNLGT
jgi:hypothetical protein